MWISYDSSEVREFHPVCERALNLALRRIGKDEDYRVIHHRTAGTLEMDFVIQNIYTGRYLCIIEVKRTPADLNSTRYQYQALSYVQMNLPNIENPFYLLTNLEYTYPFRYDVNRPRVFQQIISPGLVQTGDFNQDQDIFEENLSITYAELLVDFINNRYTYLVTLDQFEEHMRSVLLDRKRWKSSLVVMLYEYIRGAFNAIRRDDLLYDVYTFRNNIRRICNEAAQVNFKEIFDYDGSLYEPNIVINNSILRNMYDFGRQNITGNYLAEILHGIVSTGYEHEGEVQTDLELARTISVIAKGIVGEIPNNYCVCDPAAGSGNLLITAIDVFNISPNQVKANDINSQLLELLSLRIGLNYPSVINQANSPQITAHDIVNIGREYFSNVRVIVLNPPFVAGINCTDRKQLFYDRIRELSGHDAATNIRQMNLEGVFLELICSLSCEDTVIACVLPKTHLTARGPEAQAIRRLLIEELNLRVILNYPEEGLFEDVTKGTCVIFGQIGVQNGLVKIINLTTKVADVDLNQLSEAANIVANEVNFESVFPGVDGMIQSTEQLRSTINTGWRKTSREFFDSLRFIDDFIESNGKLQMLCSVDREDLPRKRGSAANSGGSDLIFLSRESDIYRNYSHLPIIPAIRKANLDCMSIQIDEGDSVSFNSNEIADNVIRDITSDYVTRPIRTGRQQRDNKTVDEYIQIINNEARHIIPRNSVLIPRGIRSRGRIYLLTSNMIVSTNFYALMPAQDEDSMVIASWMSTIFYQLICEIHAKPQEGLRKMEVQDIESTYIPRVQLLTIGEKELIIQNFASIEFLILNNPSIRQVDDIWARILYGDNYEVVLNIAKRLLEILANSRNPNLLND